MNIQLEWLYWVIFFYWNVSQITSHFNRKINSSCDEDPINRQALFLRKKFQSPASF